MDPITLLFGVPLAVTSAARTLQCLTTLPAQCIGSGISLRFKILPCRKYSYLDLRENEVQVCGRQILADQLTVLSMRHAEKDAESSIRGWK